MQRRQLAATVAAIAMSVTSGMIAIGANTGMLGGASSNPAAPVPVTAPAPVPGQPGTTSPAPAREAHPESAEAERERARTGATTATARQGGEHDD
jgi:hypothetical protein